MDPPSTSRVFFFWGLVLNYQRPDTRREAPSTPHPSLSRPGKGPHIPGGRLGFRGHRLRRPTPRSSSLPNTNGQGLRGQPDILKGRAGVPRPRGPSYESRKQKAQPIEYRDHRDHRSLGSDESLRRSPRNSSFGEHKCTLVKHSFGETQHIYPTGLRNYATLGRLARISRSVKRRKKKVTFRCSRGDSGRTDSCHSLESK